jgi:hypothetical protein
VVWEGWHREVAPYPDQRRVPASEPDLARAAIETRLTDAWMSTIIEPLIAATGAGTIIDEEDLAA